jgi:hypothetical protein
MKLDLNPLELLALHNLLHERCAPAGVLEPYDLIEDDGHDALPLRQVYAQLRTCIFEALDAKEAPAVDPRFDAWAAAQRAKIDALEAELPTATVSTGRDNKLWPAVRFAHGTARPGKQRPRRR